MHNDSNNTNEVNMNNMQSLIDKNYIQPAESEVPGDELKEVIFQQSMRKLVIYLIRNGRLLEIYVNWLVTPIMQYLCVC